MKNEIVKIKANVTQIRDGSEYKGAISLEGQRFYYHLNFKVPLYKIDKLAKENWEKAEKSISLKIMDAKGGNLSLDDKVRGLFLTTATTIAVNFYNNPQTRDSNSGISGRIVRREKDLEEYEFFRGQMSQEDFDKFIQITFGMSSEYQWRRTPELEKFLQNYKNNPETQDSNEKFLGKEIEEPPYRRDIHRDSFLQYW